MPFIQRYSDVKKGGITFCGNTLGLSKATNQNAPGTQGSIGAFTSLDNSLQVGTFPAGWTLDYTNTVSIDIISNRMTVVKSVDKAYAVVGDNLHYTTVITNTGSLLKSDLVFTDPIPAGTSFVAGSVKIDGAAYPAYNPQTGFPLPDLAVGQSVTVEFDVKVN